MNTYPRWCLVFVLLNTIFLHGCVDSKLEAGSGDEQSETVTAFFDEDGAATQVLNARSPDQWVYFDLETFSVVIPQNPQNDTVWDVAFQRFKIKINGGVNGSGGVEVAGIKNTGLLTVSVVPTTGFVTDRPLSELPDEELLLLGDNVFFSVCESGFDNEDDDNYCLANDQVNRDHLNPDESAFAFLTQGSGVVMEEGSTRDNHIDGDPILGWYDYFLHEGSILRPTSDTWIIRSTEGVEFTLEMLGYYGLLEGDAESGTIAFRYLSITPNFEIPLPGEQQLLAEANVDIVSGVAPLITQFQGNASGTEGNPVWHWDFGDGSSSDVQNPQHTYTLPGDYIATLTVSDNRGAGAAVIVSVIVTVTEAGALPPVANAGADQNITLNVGETNATVTLDGSLSLDADGVIVSYLWAGTPDPDDTATPDIQLSAGSYDFTLTITDDNGNAVSDEVNIVVNPADNQLPIAVATQNVESGVAPLSVVFMGSASNDSDGSIVNWHWDFDDGTTLDGVANPPSHDFLPGVYNVVLTVTDDKAASNSTSLIVRSGYSAIQDTYVYEFLGNQGEGINDNGTTDPSDDFQRNGDSGGLQVWQHNNVHGGKALIQFDSAASTTATALGAGNYTATLHLYHVCELGGFVNSCPGFADSNNPFTPPTATVKVDVVLQQLTWLENDAELAWGDIAEVPNPFVTLTLSTNSGWSSIDVTTLVDAWVTGSTDFGFSLSQEAYPVIRDDSDFNPVVSFCDSESSEGDCQSGNFHPYLVIEEVQ